jgi:hypothetical protein
MRQDDTLVVSLYHTPVLNNSYITNVTLENLSITVILVKRCYLSASGSDIFISKPQEAWA